MLQKKATGRITALLLTFALIFSATPITVFAEDTGSLCTHTIHDAACGYAEGADCVHAHDGDCGYIEATPEVPCDMACEGETHAEGCAYAPAVPGGDCTHIHSEACGYIEAASCGHVHDENCGGLPPAATEKDCVCESLCAEGSVSDACPVCAEDFSLCEYEAPILSTLAAATITIAPGELGDTVLRIPQGTPLTEADLLKGVSAVDENGDTVTVTVSDTGGLTLDNPQPKGKPGVPEAYTITYTAGEATVTRECFVTVVGIMPLAGVASDFSTLEFAVAVGGTVTITDDITMTGTIDIIGAIGNVTIDGNGHTLIRGGGHKDAFFQVYNSGSLTLENITLDGNKDTVQADSALISSVGNLTIENSELKNNYYTGGGGAIASLGSAVLNNVTISGNLAHYGGGIFSAGNKLTINGCKIRENSASVRLSSSTTSSRRGGGIFLAANTASVVEIIASEISGNVASAGGGGIYKDRAGGTLSIDVASLLKDNEGGLETNDNLDGESVGVTDSSTNGYTLSYSAGENGTVSAAVSGVPVNSGDVVKEGATVLLTAAPSPDFRIKEWKLNGGAVNGRAGTYSLPMTTKSDVAVVFELIPDTSLEISGGSSYTYENDVLTITGGGNYTIKNVNPGAPTTDRIVVAADVTATVTLAGVNIDASSIAQSPLLLGAGANLTVNLEAGSTNTLTAGGSYAGLQTASDTSLTIGGTGSLIAKSGWGSAGIGGNQTSSANQNSGGNITITGGNITATGSDNGAGIGSGACSNGTAGNNSGTIIIRGNATVVASSGSGAGIGAGSAGSGTYILICDGANVEATSNRGAGIGGGINSAPGGGGGGNILIYGENTQVVAEHSRIGSGGDFASSNILAMAGVVSQWGWTPNDPPYAQIGGNPVTFTASPASSGTVTVTLPAFFNTSPFAIAAGAPITLITGLDSTGKTLQMFADYSDEEFVFSLPGYPSVTKTGAELSAAGASVDFVANNPAPVPDPNPAPKPSRPNPSYDRSDDDSSYTPAPTPVEQWMSAANLRNPSRDTLRFGVRASVWDALTGKYYHDSLRNGVVEVRAYFDDPGLFTRDAYVSGWVSGTSVTSIRSLFEKYFSNKIRTIHFDQSGKWENPIKIAAKIDFAGIDTTKLVFYSYDSTTNSYRRLEAPAYRIDANGYLRFTTEYAGEIIISEGGLEKR